MTVKSLEVIRNGTIGLQYIAYEFLLAFHIVTMTISRIISPLGNVPVRIVP